MTKRRDDLRETHSRPAPDPQIRLWIIGEFFTVTGHMTAALA